MPGTTFAPEDIGWIDFETKGPVDLKEVGAYGYAMRATPIICAYAIGDAPATTFTAYREGECISLVDLPLDFVKHLARVVAGTAVWAAWNAGFDRAIWNHACDALPEMAPRHFIDVMAQAVASGLPPDLAMAAKFSGSTHKVASGRELIKLFCLPTSTATPSSHPAEWHQFRHVYAPGDIEAMRSVFKRTMQLPLAEWREYWAMEAINDRGVAVDLKLAGNAAVLAGEDRAAANAEIKRLTGGVVNTVDQVAVMSRWLLDRLPAEGRAIMTKREEEVDEEGNVTKPAKHALTRARVERLIVEVAAQIKHPNIIADYADELRGVLRVLQIRLYGGSKTPAKFSKLLSQHVDGVLYGQYVFNGAPQTGRASSRGVQVHNLARSALEYEHEAIEALLRCCSHAELAALGDDSPVSRKLSLLIRPTFVPEGDNVFVWSDWSQIEARVLPWLADYLAGAKARVQLFSAVDVDPRLPDLYTVTAAKLSGVAVDKVDKSMRQRGKVAELALGFCGGVGALQAMAAGYGLHFTDKEARRVVDDWRAANPWVMTFAQDLMGAVRMALENPRTAFKVGRLWLRFYGDYLGGTLRIRLPSGRCLNYRRLRMAMLDVLDEDDKPTGRQTLEMVFERGYGRVKAWPGLFVENVTQATAADFLRGTLVRLEKDFFDWAPTRLHTHDEILLEVDAGWATHAASRLSEVMQQGFDWSEGLPIMSEETVAYYYTKNEEGHGL
jgi:DNA polymerase